MRQFENPEDARTLALAIVETIPEPFVVLDDSFCVVAANNAFYSTFEIDPSHSHGITFFDLASGQWDIPVLRDLLTTAIQQHRPIAGFEFERDVSKLGRRTMLLTTMTVGYDGALRSNTLLVFRDVTEARKAEADKQAYLERTEALLAQQRVLFQEMQHRVANSLQIIASILMLKARAVTSQETRHHLEDAHQRVMSVAAVQNYLYLTDGIDQIEVAAYLNKLCAGLAKSIVLDSNPVRIDVTANESCIPSQTAVSLGLIVTELVINAVKYAFPRPKPDARVLVSYEVQDTAWKLVVSDNGVGKGAVQGNPKPGSGFGTLIIEALAKQLDARVETSSSSTGLSVSITHATFTSRMPNTA
ncbi:PAS domain-containing protein [Ensifer sp. HO-A22]|uniref:histidine kinase n=1 Tax=Ensifer oleiphilus TaxID=2742698 RepID=A0A7Y6UNS5_9HYPH|nr:histidine kinase dimerization/phosphoacceptor domain -containing protein [Ensifer oleiphilus]NVD39933.1 PAS domain-containing protein [Ensifer oleiphilus]